MSTSHFEAVIVRRQNPRTKVYENLVLDYEPKREDGTYGEIQLKYPGGMKETGEKLGDAAIRELFEETGLVIRDRNRRHLDLMRVISDTGIPQAFFTIDRSKCGGKLKTEVQFEANSRLSNRRWVAEDELYEDLFPTHRKPLRLAIVRPRTSRSELAKCG